MLLNSPIEGDDVGSSGTFSESQEAADFMAAMGGMTQGG